MKIIIISLLLILIDKVYAQSNINDKNVAALLCYDIESVYYSTEFENLGTIYTLCGLPKQNNWKIYFDIKEKQIATLYNYDSITHNISVKHYNRSGKLIKEIVQSNFSQGGDLNIGYPRVQHIVYIKTYLNDSLLCEVNGYNSYLTLNYFNFQTNSHFQMKIGYFENTYNSVDLWEYYKNGSIKTMESRLYKYGFSNDGTGMQTVSLFKSYSFDENGCIIKVNKK